MRIAIACSLVVLAACGGAQKPATTEADTSSLETGGSAAPATTETASPAASSGAPAATPATGASDPSAAQAANPAPFHPVPSSAGSIDGKPFAPKFAQLAGPVQKDGRVLIVLHEGSDCATASDASISLLVPWKDGYKTDLASLKRAKAGNTGEAAFVRQADGKKTVSSTFKPTGLVTVVSAPTQKDAIGKMKIDLQSGDYMLAGDLDVKVCVGGK